VRVPRQVEIITRNCRLAGHTDPLVRDACDLQMNRVAAAG